MTRRFWTAEELRLLRELYPVRSTAAVAALLNRPIESVYHAAHIHLLHKSAEFYESEESGRLRKGQTRPESIASQFHQGHVPANKGLRRPGWAPGRMKETQFKKGARTGMAGRNWRPVGTILPDSDGYLRIKVREARYGAEPTGFGNTQVWPMLARQTWQEHHGPIPAGHAIVYMDGDRSNCAIENLECISRAELARRNSMWTRMPRELAEVIQLAGALKRKLRRLSHEEQNVGSAQPSV